jgi:hypothetical protein
MTDWIVGTELDTAHLSVTGSYAQVGVQSTFPWEPPTVSNAGPGAAW